MDDILHFSRWRISKSILDRRVEDARRVLNLSHKNLSDIPDYRGKHWTTINIAGNPIKTLERLKPLNTLIELIIDHTQISSFKGYQESPFLQVFTCYGTPLCNLPNFYITCAIALGENIKCVNGRLLTTRELNYANRYRQRVIYEIYEGYVITALNPLRLFNPITKNRKTIICDPPVKRKYGIDVENIDDVIAAMSNYQNSPKITNRAPYDDAVFKEADFRDFHYNTKNVLHTYTSDLNLELVVSPTPDQREPSILGSPPNAKRSANNSPLKLDENTEEEEIGHCPITFM